MKYYYKCFILLLVHFLFVPELSAQDTEVKDEVTIIKVYIRLNYIDSACVVCPDELKGKLEAIEGAWEVKIFPLKKLATFYMYSTQIISEKKLNRLVKQAGFIPLKIDYSKEKIENEKDDHLSL